MTHTTVLPEPTYTIHEANNIIGFSKDAKYLYKLANQNKVLLQRDNTGQLRISKAEVERLLRNRSK